MENQHQKRKKAQRRTYIARGGVLSGAEGASRASAAAEGAAGGAQRGLQRACSRATTTSTTQMQHVHVDRT
jgi:hypothetical protein